jgi:structure-specific endonuclease subunit SLX1
LYTGRALTSLGLADIRFPSKLAALQVGVAPDSADTQFEWAWQKPELSRHLREEGLPMYKKDNKRNWVERKVA